MCVLRFLTSSVQPAGHGDPATNRPVRSLPTRRRRHVWAAWGRPRGHAEAVAGAARCYGPPPGIPAAGAGRPLGGSCPTITGLTTAEERLTATRLVAQVTLDMPLIRTHNRSEWKTHSARTYVLTGYLTGVTVAADRQRPGYLRSKPQVSDLEAMPMGHTRSS